MNKFSEKALGWLTYHVAFPIIRKYESDSPLIKHYENEGGKMRDVKDLLAVFGTQGHSGASAPFIINCFHRVVQWKVLSPLKFTDDEFGRELGVNDKTRQNKRMSSVFKYPNGVIKDIDAITWFEETGVRYDKAYDAFVGCEYASKGYGFHGGTVILYNDIENDAIEGQESNPDLFHVVGSGQEIDNLRDFMGEHKVRVPVIEIYDSTDSHNDFFCHFARMSDIPKEFFIDYCLFWDGERDEKCKEEIEYCKPRVWKFCDMLERKGLIDCGR